MLERESKLVFYAQSTGTVISGREKERQTDRDRDREAEADRQRQTNRQRQRKTAVWRPCWYLAGIFVSLFGTGFIITFRNQLLH